MHPKARTGAQIAVAIAVVASVVPVPARSPRRVLDHHGEIHELSVVP
jgi:hypothetical protein